MWNTFLKLIFLLKIIMRFFDHTKMNQYLFIALIFTANVILGRDINQFPVDSKNVVVFSIERKDGFKIRKLRLETGSNTTVIWTESNKSYTGDEPDDPVQGVVAACLRGNVVGVQLASQWAIIVVLADIEKQTSSIHRLFVPEFISIPNRSGHPIRMVTPNRFEVVDIDGSIQSLECDINGKVWRNGKSIEVPNISALDMVAMSDAQMRKNFPKLFSSTEPNGEHMVEVSQSGKKKILDGASGVSKVALVAGLIAAALVLVAVTFSKRRKRSRTPGAN